MLRNSALWVVKGCSDKNSLEAEQAISTQHQNPWYWKCVDFYVVFKECQYRSENCSLCVLYQNLLNARTGKNFISDIEKVRLSFGATVKYERRKEAPLKVTNSCFCRPMTEGHYAFLTTHVKCTKIPRRRKACERVAVSFFGSTNHYWHFSRPAIVKRSIFNCDYIGEKCVLPVRDRTQKKHW